jgi:hypothetical protein
MSLFRLKVIDKYKKRIDGIEDRLHCLSHHLGESAAVDKYAKRIDDIEDKLQRMNNRLDASAARVTYFNDTEKTPTQLPISSIAVSNFTAIESIYGKFIVNRYCHYKPSI